ncbi:DUF732 domain-containing protein [Actinoplanes sp. CA-015351]|uniref:DUF732 domain-containing protein n=1 Tax=Actinoplanes sp. CA-015351 TaxID=3239897 RepID=UPI003D97A57A
MTAALPVLAGCGTAPGVPEWKNAAPQAAPPSPATTSVAPSEAPSDVPSPLPSYSVSVAATVSVSPTPPRVATWPSPTPSAGFVAAVQGRLPEVALDRRPEEITELGDQACQGLAAGKRRPTVAENLLGYGLSGADARVLVSLASSHLCRA